MENKKSELSETISKFIASIALLFIYAYILQWTWNTVAIHDYHVSGTEIPYLHTLAVCLSLNGIRYFLKG